MPFDGLSDRERISLGPAMPLTPVVAAVIQRNGRVLICRRPRRTRHGGRWEFPSGAMHDGESVAEAIRRELVEQLHVQPARVGRVRHAIADPETPFLIQYVDVTIAGEPRPTAHDAVAWVEPARLCAYALAPSDRLFAASSGLQEQVRGDGPAT